MKLKSKLLIITVSLIFLAILTAALGVRLLSDLEEANSKWSRFTEVESAKVQALTDINRHFGYGGFIHHFKNLILRKDLQYLSLAEQSINNTYTSIDQYLSIVDDTEESACLIRFKNVVDLYYQKIQMAQFKRQLETYSPISLDALVKVDDSDALLALRTLTVSIQNRSLKIQSDTEDMMRQSSNFLLVAGSILITILLVVIFVVVSIAISLVKSIRYNRMLFEFAPDAMLVTSEQGQILRVNKKAIKLFGYSFDEFLTLSVDDLVPQDIRPYHRKFRDEYLKKENGLGVSAGSIPFRAISKSGVALPVEVSLMQHHSYDENLNVAIIRDLTKQEELKQASQVDHLTQLLNRRSIDRKVAELLMSQESDGGFGLMLMDIDKFKRVNDDLGHQEGDKVLQQVAQVIANMTPEGAFSGRFGGEEFIMVCPDFDIQQIYNLAELVRLAVQQKISILDSPLTISIGVTVSKQQDGMVNILARADTALYEAKDTGRNRVVLYRKFHEQ